MDVLSDILHAIRLTGSFLCRTEASAPWAIRIDKTDIARFHVVRRGNCWFHMTGMQDPISLANGDLIFLPYGHEHILGDDPAAKPIALSELIKDKKGGDHEPLQIGGKGLVTTILCGSCQFDREKIHPLLSVLPPLIYIKGDDDRAIPWLEATMDFISSESSSSRPGAGAIINRLVDILIVQIMRIYIDSLPDDASGWLRGLKDPQIGKSLGNIHRQPEYPWTIESLSASVGMSRASFAAKFKEFVGESPYQYLTRWRMYKASKYLEMPNKPLSDIASQVGYQTETAFSKVFKRHLGISPSLYRRQLS